jgi:hypothetical protein
VAHVVHTKIRFDRGKGVRDCFQHLSPALHCLSQVNPTVCLKHVYPAFWDCSLFKTANHHNCGLFLCVFAEKRKEASPRLSVCRGGSRQSTGTQAREQTPGRRTHASARPPIRISRETRGYLKSACVRPTSREIPAANGCELAELLRKETRAADEQPTNPLFSLSLSTAPRVCAYIDI